MMAAVLLAADMFITVIAEFGGMHADAAGITSSTLAQMRARAEAIINYEWVPSQDVETWNNSLYNGAAVFPAGSTVRGMPYTLFTSEEVSDSLLSMAQYSEVTAGNYSVKARCASKNNKWRTGPVYGSCCATFISEIFGGSFMDGDNPRYDSVSRIEASTYASHITEARADMIQAGDALSKKGHIIWIGDVTDDSFVIYEQTPPVAHKVVVSKDSAVNSDGFLEYKGSIYSTVSRINVTGSDPSVTAPELMIDHDCYAQGAAVEMSWAAVPGASYYLLDVARDGECIVEEQVQTSEHYMIDNGNGSYEVSVTAVSGSHRAASGKRFTVGRLDAPVITSEGKYFASGDNITVRWTSCAGATSYHVTVSRDGGEIFREANLNSCSLSFEPDDGYYEFRVDAINENGGLQTASSEKYGFDVGNKRQIVIDSADAYYPRKADVTLNWNYCEGVSEYMLRIYRNNRAYLNKKVSGGTEYTLSGLPDGKYETVVSAVESSGEYDWQPSEKMSFYVGKPKEQMAVSE